MVVNFYVLQVWGVWVLFFKGCLHAPIPGPIIMSMHLPWENLRLIFMCWKTFGSQSVVDLCVGCANIWGLFWCWWPKDNYQSDIGDPANWNLDLICDNQLLKLLTTICCSTNAGPFKPILTCGSEPQGRIHALCIALRMRMQWNGLKDSGQI